ncbi:MAG: outer membrane beta-barrel protein [Rikenellaceae bacterium]
MKLKTTILAMAMSLFAGTAVFAQTSGDIVVGGAIGYSSANEGDDTSFTIMPHAHYFLNDNWAVGGAIGYMSSKTNDVTDYSAFVIEPSAYFYYEIANNLYFAPKGYVSYVNDSELDMSGFGIGVDLARFEYKLSDNIGFGLSLPIASISYNSVTVGDADAANSFYLGVNSDGFNMNSFTFSFNYYFK